MSEEILELQQLTFFTEGNTYTGGRTKNRETGALLRYLVRPDKENGTLLAYAWKEDLCFECSQEREEASFPLSEEGLEEAQVWLQKLYQAL